MPSILDQQERRILDAVQRQAPLVESPYKQIGEQLGLHEAEVLERIAALRSTRGGVIRQISAISTRDLAVTAAALSPPEWMNRSSNPPWRGGSGVSVDELLVTRCRYIEIGCMRRFSAVLRHRAAGFEANAMGAWVVPDARCDAFGAAARFSAAGHCYKRPTYEDWPYSMFTMVHGRSSRECESVLGAISRKTGITQHQALYSSDEFRKVRARYFMRDIERWEAEALPGSHK